MSINMPNETAAECAAGTFFFAASFDSAYPGGILYRANGSRVEMSIRGPVNEYPSASEAPEVSHPEFGWFYWECALLQPGRYWHIKRDTLYDDELTLIEVGEYGFGREQRMLATYSKMHVSDMLRNLHIEGVPQWVQAAFLGGEIHHEIKELVKLSGRPPLDNLRRACFTQLHQPGMWVYSDGKRTLVVDLIEGAVAEKAHTLPRKVKKALSTLPRQRTLRQRRRIANIKIGSLQHWSGGFHFNDTIDWIPFDANLRETFTQMSALMDGRSLIDPECLFGGVKYVILEELTAHRRLTYKDAYKYASEWFGSDGRLGTPVGSYRYDLLFHAAWCDIAFEVRRAAAAAPIF